MQSQPTPSVDSSLSLNEILKRYPAARTILNAHGLDTCCGGAESLRSAALEAHADLRTILGELSSVAIAGAR